MQLMSSIFILRKLIAQSVLGVETLIHFTKSIVKKSLEGKWGKMFHQLEEQINGYRNMNPDCKVVYQLFDPDMSDALIIAIVTPLMTIIHTEVLA